MLMASVIKIMSLMLTIITAMEKVVWCETVT